MRLDVTFTTATSREPDASALRFPYVLDHWMLSEQLHGEMDWFGFADELFCPFETEVEGCVVVGLLVVVVVVELVVLRLGE